MAHEFRPGKHEFAVTLERLNPKFGAEHLHPISGSKRPPNPLVKETSTGAIGEYDSRRRRNIGLPGRFFRGD